MSDFSLDVLQDYFDDLLTPAAPPAEPALQRAVPKLLAEVSCRPIQTAVDDQARQKLERLFASRPLQVAPEPLAIATPSLDTASDPEPVVRSLAAADVALAAAVAAESVASPTDITESSAAQAGDEQREAATPAADAADAADSAATASFGWSENGRPDWAQDRFDVLLFEVAGLTLAVPLMSLGQIQPLTDELTPLFGQADWFMGLQPTPMGKIRTINTARFVMPERYQEHFIDAARYVISIAGLPWGLAVDAVNQPITLHPDDVRWRSERSKRPWLAGTVKQHMCALLDIQTMGHLLQQAEQTGSRTDPLKA